MHFSIQHAENGKIKRVKFEDVTDRAPVFIDHPDGVQYKLTRTTISVYRKDTLVAQLPLPTQASDYGRGWGEGPRLSHEDMQELLTAKAHAVHTGNQALFLAALRGEDNIYNQWAELKLQDEKYSGPLEFPTAERHRVGFSRRPRPINTPALKVGGLMVPEDKENDVVITGRAAALQLSGSRPLQYPK